MYCCVAVSVPHCKTSDHPAPACAPAVVWLLFLHSCRQVKLVAPILLAYSLEFETSASVCYLFLLFSAVLAVLVFLQQRRNLLQQNPVCAGTAMCDAISAARLVLPSQSDAICLLPRHWAGQPCLLSMTLYPPSCYLCQILTASCSCYLIPTSFVCDACSLFHFSRPVLRLSSLQGEADPHVLPHANAIIGDGKGLANSSGNKAYGSF